MRTRSVSVAPSGKTDDMVRNIGQYDDRSPCSRTSRNAAEDDETWLTIRSTITSCVRVDLTGQQLDAHEVHGVNVDVHRLRRPTHPLRDNGFGLDGHGAGRQGPDDPGEAGR